MHIVRRKDRVSTPGFINRTASIATCLQQTILQALYTYLQTRIDRKAEKNKQLVLPSRHRQCPDPKAKSELSVAKEVQPPPERYPHSAKIIRNHPPKPAVPSGKIFKSLTRNGQRDFPGLRCDCF